MLLVIISTVGNGMIRLQKSQAAGSYGSNYGPVSYTHLDVYKRQVLHLQLLDSRLMKLSRMKHSQDVFGKHIQVYML